MPWWPGGVVHWARRFLACNPFYLVSAALLLYGIYRVSTDASFLPREAAQLAFNFSSLEFYELLLVATAIFLARRRIWYDSTLLVGLENLLVFVPFILVTQAVLIERRSVWIICGAGTILAVLRFGGLKRFLTELHLPGRVLLLGLGLLALNVALPIVYRSVLDQNRFGTRPTEGVQYETARYTWLLVLPAAFALGNLLPKFRPQGTLLPQRRWLPTGFFGLWLLATAVHVYCLDYVYEFKLPAAWIAPGLWILAWTAYRRVFDLLPVPEQPWKHVLLTAPVLLPLLAAAESRPWIFLSLAGLNILIYAAIWFRDRHSRLGLHLLAAAVFLFLSGVPEEWIRFAVPALDPGRLVALGMIGYLTAWTVWLRNPKLAILAAVVLAGTILAVFGRHAGAGHWALQCGLVFLLLHSLRWEDAREPGAGAVRGLAAIVWVAHAFVWMQALDHLWLACVPGGAVLGVCLALRLIEGHWRRLGVPLAAALVALCGPVNALSQALRAAPTALLLVVASFICFGLGTVAALTKHRWHPRSSADAPE
jgi:hypothetical protein